MKKAYLLGVFAMFLLACSGIKKTQEAINSGNYVSAMNTAINNLQANKTKKGHQEYITLLEAAFAKNTEREMSEIEFLTADGNPANLERVYAKYQNLIQIQQRIQPLLPLTIKAEQREAQFSFGNYTNALTDTKEALSTYLYNEALSGITTASVKEDYRAAHEQLNRLEEINPGYRDCPEKIAETRAKGIDYVQVQLQNHTQQVIPKRLETELLDFNSFGINTYWTRFHTNATPDINYDYALDLNFEEIVVSPERVNEKQLVQEKQIKDGFEYLTNEDGVIVKDSLGQKIKVDRLVTVKCSLYQFSQYKNVVIGARARFIDLSNQQEISAYPLASEYIFEHVYANYKGDKRALDQVHLQLLDAIAVPFPSNEQMIYKAGEDLKENLKEIIQRLRLD